MIKTIFFDFDGVLTTDSNGSGTICRNIQKVIPELSFDNLYRCYRAHHSLLLLGKAKHADIWNDFCSCLGEKIDINILHDTFKNTPKNEQMFQFCQVLKKKYKTGIITDNTKERFELLVKEMELDKCFDFIILSANIGKRKDEPFIFQEALQMAGCRAEECVFIDNQKRNLVIPSEMGFHTFWHDEEKNDLMVLQNQLRDWGIAPD